MYYDAYLNKLQRDTAERRAARNAEAAVAAADPLANLRVRIAHWQSSLPAEARPAFYFMSDLVRILGAPAQQIGVALDAIGWTRRRTWERGRPHRNRWFPPDTPIQ